MVLNMCSDFPIWFSILIETPSRISHHVWQLYSIITCMPNSDILFCYMYNLRVSSPGIQIKFRHFYVCFMQLLESHFGGLYLARLYFQKRTSTGLLLNYGKMKDNEWTGHVFTQKFTFHKAGKERKYVNDQDLIWQLHQNRRFCSTENRSGQLKHGKDPNKEPASRLPGSLARTVTAITFTQGS